MFDNIAEGYDDLNRNMSLGVDSRWRQFVIDYLKIRSVWPVKVLDVATGTGDMALMAAVQLNPDSVIGVDISEEMMRIGREKVEAAGLSNIITLLKEDCASMSFEDDTFDAVISAFALRNFEDISQCLKEMYRVLAPGGSIAVIDLCKPRRFPMKQLFAIYRKCVMPFISHRFIGDKEAANYLNDTMNVVPVGKDMAKLFKDAGFKDVGYRSLPSGICYLYSGTK